MGKKGGVDVISLVGEKRQWTWILLRLDSVGRRDAEVRFLWGAPGC